MTLAYYGFVLAALSLQLLMGANNGGTLLGSALAAGLSGSLHRQYVIQILEGMILAILAGFVLGYVLIKVVNVAGQSSVQVAPGILLRRACAGVWSQ